MDLTTGIPPGVKVQLKLYRNLNKIAIDSYDSNPDYKFVIRQAHLHVPVAIMTSSIFSEYEEKLKKSVAKLR